MGHQEEVGLMVLGRIDRVVSAIAVLPALEVLLEVVDEEVWERRQTLITSVQSGKILTIRMHTSAREMYPSIPKVVVMAMVHMNKMKGVPKV
jgi:hypothetical protein